MALATEAVKSKFVDSLTSATAFSVAKTALKKMVRKKNRTHVPRGQEVVKSPG